MRDFKSGRLVYDKDEVLGFVDEKYINNKVRLCQFRFLDDRLFYVDIGFDMTDDLNSLRKEIADYISSKYGKPELKRTRL